MKLEWMSWIRLAAGIVFGFFGVRALTGDPNWILGIPLQAISCWLLLTALPVKTLVPAMKTIKASSSKPKASKKKTKSFIDKSYYWVLGPLVLTVLCRTFFYFDLVKWGVETFLVSLIFLGILKIRARSGIESAESLVKSKELLSDRTALFILLAVAVLMRFPFLGQNFTGLQIDEANDLMDGINVMNGSLNTPFGVGWWANPSLPYFVLAGFFKLFGVHLVVARGLSALLACAALWFFYRFCRFFFDVMPSFLAALFLNFSWWFLFYSLSPFDDIFTVTFGIGTFYFMEKALREGKRRDFWWAGFLAGASVMTYISGRLIPVMAVAALAGIAVIQRPPKFWATYGRSILLFFLAFLWFLGPFIIFIWHQPDQFFGRARELSIFNQVKMTGNYTLPFRNFFWSLVSLFHASPAVDPRFNIPGNCEVDPFTGIVVLLGLQTLVVSAFRFKGRFFWYVTSGVFFGIVANAFAVQGSTPNSDYTNDQRYFIILPFLMMLAAAGLDWVIGLFANYPIVLRRVGILVLALFLAGAAFLNGKVYYSDFPNNRGLWSSLGFNHIKAAEAGLAYYPRCHLLVQANSDSSVFEFITYNRVKFTQYSGVPITNAVSRNVAVVFSPWDWTGSAEIVKAYPHTTFTDFHDPWGDRAIQVAEIPLADIQASQKKLKALGPALP
jgi:hypothetical protein